MILELQKPIPMTCPKGAGYAHFLIDHGKENDNEWIIFLDNGEIWSFLNPDVRLQKNITYRNNLENDIKGWFKEKKTQSVCF